MVTAVDALDEYSFTFAVVLGPLTVGAGDEGARNLGLRLDVEGWFIAKTRSDGPEAHLAIALEVQTSHKSLEVTFPDLTLV